MKITRWPIDADAVRAGKQNGEPSLQCGNPCPCGCSPSPWVYISDGEMGITARFDSPHELEQFKFSLSLLEFPQQPK